MTEDLIAALRKAHDEAGDMPQGTMDHKTQWRRFAALYNAVEHLLDVIEHPEWEYGVVGPTGRMVNNGDYQPYQTHRRRKAGPWEEIPRG